MYLKKTHHMMSFNIKVYLMKNFIALSKIKYFLVNLNGILKEIIFVVIYNQGQLNHPLFVTCLFKQTNVNV